jgi:hypothetical protein
VRAPLHGRTPELKNTGCCWYLSLLRLEEEEEEEEEVRRGRNEVGTMRSSPSRSRPEGEPFHGRLEPTPDARRPS